METDKVITVKEFSGKYFINEAYRPIAKALIEKYLELKHIASDSILFVEDRESLKKNKGQLVFAQISAIPEKWGDIVYQASGHPFEYLLEIYRFNISMMSREQVIAVIYHELRHIGTDGEIKAHDIEDWSNMVQKLGLNWTDHKKTIPDLLDEDVDWNSIQGPANLFPSDTVLTVIKGGQDD